MALDVRFRLETSGSGWVRHGRFRLHGVCHLSAVQALTSLTLQQVRQLGPGHRCKLNMCLYFAVTWSWFELETLPSLCLITWMLLEKQIWVFLR